MRCINGRANELLPLAVFNILLHDIADDLQRSFLSFNGLPFARYHFHAFHVWLDARWSAGVLTAQMMLLGVMPYVAHYALSAALLAMNKQALIAVNSTVQSIATVVVVAMFAPLGLNAAAAAIALRPLATAAIPIAFARRECKITVRTVLRAQAPVFIAAIAMGAIVSMLSLVMPPAVKPGAVLVILIAAGAISYAILIRFILPAYAAAFLARFRRSDA